MSSIGNIGDKPDPSKFDLKDAKQAAEYQDQNASYWNAVQSAQHAQNLAEDAQSNMQKANADALMNIVNNLK